MATSEYEFDTLPQVLDHLLGRDPSEPVWFRGQGCGSYGLRPSLYRRLTSPSPQEVLDIESRLILRFRQRSLPWWPEGYPQTDWEHLFAMQHYGVPTRLLDWSESALAGLYFSADHRVDTCACKTGACLPTLWVLDPVLMNKLNPRRDGMEARVLTSKDADFWRPNVSVAEFAPMPVALYGTHNSVRIAAQQGTFTVAGKDPQPLDETDLGEKPGVLEKITLNCSHTDLLGALRLLGVKRASVYPGLPGASADIAAEEVFDA